MSEQDLTRAILQALKAHGFWCWRNNSGVMRINDRKYGKRVIRMSPSGSPDIIGVLSPSGRLFGLEVKAESGKQRDSQAEWQREAEQHGARYAIVRSIGTAIHTVDEWQRIENRLEKRVIRHA